MQDTRTAIERCRRGEARPAAWGVGTALAVWLVAGAAGAVDGEHSGVSSLNRLLVGNPLAVALVDPVLFVGLDSGLAIYDVADPVDPVLLAHRYLPGPAYDVAVEGNFAYLACGEVGLVVIDVADPSNPLVRSTLPGALPGTVARAVAVAGGIAYLAESGPGSPLGSALAVIDVANPFAPVLLGRTLLPNGGLAVALDGAVAQVGFGASSGVGAQGLIAIDVSDPGAPAAVPGGRLDLDKPVNDLVLGAGLAYLASGHPSSGALVVVGVGDPSSPIELSRVPLSDGARGVALQAGVVLVATRMLGLMAFDISDPAAPVALDALPAGREAVAVVSRGDVAFVAERSSIGPAALGLVSTVFPSSLTRIGGLGFAEATAVATTPGLGWLLERDALHLVDTSDPLAPATLAVWRPPGVDLSALAVEGSLAAVGNGDTVMLVDATDPFLPVAAGSVRLANGYVSSLTMDAGLLYALSAFGLEIIDVASPSSPTPLGALLTDDWASAIAVDGTLGYLVAGEELLVVDLAAPLTPTVIGSLRISWEQLYGVAVRGELAVVTGLSNELYAVDVSDPASPILQGFVPGGSGFDVALIGDRAVVAGGAAGLRVHDIVDPLAPFLAGWYDTSGEAFRLATDGTEVWLVTGAAQHWMLSCDLCSTSCVESSPTVAPNSLRAVRLMTSQQLSWSLAGGTGTVNVHRTANAGTLPGLWSDMATRVGGSAGRAWSESVDPPPGQTAFYRVFGASSCSGRSVGP